MGRDERGRPDTITPTLGWPAPRGSKSRQNAAHRHKRISHTHSSRSVCVCVCGHTTRARSTAAILLSEAIGKNKPSKKKIEARETTKTGLSFSATRVYRASPINKIPLNRRFNSNTTKIKPVVDCCFFFLLIIFFKR